MDHGRSGSILHEMLDHALNGEEMSEEAREILSSPDSPPFVGLLETPSAPSLSRRLGLPEPLAHAFPSFLESQRSPAYAVGHSINDVARAQACSADCYNLQTGQQGDWGEHLLPVVAGPSANSAWRTGGGGSGAVSPVQQPLGLLEPPAHVFARSLEGQRDAVQRSINDFTRAQARWDDYYSLQTGRQGVWGEHRFLIVPAGTSADGARRTGSGGSGAVTPVQQPLALIRVGMENNPYEALENFSQGLAASQDFTRSSGGRRGGISNVCPACALEMRIDLEAGQQGNPGAHLQPVVAATTSADSARHTGSGAVVAPFEERRGRGAVPPIQEPVNGSWGTSSGAVSPIQEQGDSSRSGTVASIQQPAEYANMPEGVMIQAAGSFLPGCATVYSVLNGAPDYIKFATFLGLASITGALFIGIQSRTVARRQMVMQLVPCLAISFLTFIVASQFSEPIYIGLTAFLGVVVNLLLMFLRFR